MNKKQKNFYLDDDTIQYIINYKNSHSDISSEASALRKIIEEHKHKGDISPTKVLVDALAKQVAEELKDTLTRIRLGSNNADRNSEVILLLLNSLLSYSGYKSLIDKDTEQLLKAKQIVKDRISNYRQRRIDKEKPETSPPIFTDDDFSQ